MKELFCSNEPVLLSFVEALFNEAGVGHVVADANMSIVEGSLGILPRRMFVSRDHWSLARRVLAEAGLDDVTGQTRESA